ncbi:hypothetical protein T265_10333 [Opisthorchis viverrini]|uniref:Uncharacterized protein n=1 Tax=Opisthorchis viverrini TaxID=6198 RepID=A0A074Z2W3_OPIVI|nr:hypothetical protein T265_10333 [Opisthorchis viverrini]KER21333.1 hypothetical protein T265_10333 [Opisthorchis viverrini]
MACLGAIRKAHSWDKKKAMPSFKDDSVDKVRHALNAGHLELTFASRATLTAGNLTTLSHHQYVSISEGPDNQSGHMPTQLTKQVPVNSVKQIIKLIHSG